MRNEVTSQGFSSEDRRRLREALEAAGTPRLYRRLLAVTLVAEGKAVAEVASDLSVHAKSVRRWVSSYLEDRDAAALDDQPRSGRPPHAIDLSSETIANVLATDPRSLGYMATTWTVPLLAQYLTEQGQPLSQRTLRRRLHALGYRWKRPRYRYVNRPNRAERAGKKGLSSAA